MSQKKQRGAQRRNNNARQHGFYARHYTDDELSLIAEFVNDPSLDDEIWMQRVLNRRLLKFADPGADQTPTIDQLIRIAEALATGTGRVARLLRDKRALSGDAADGIASAIATALDELATEMNLPL